MEFDALIAELEHAQAQAAPASAPSAETLNRLADYVQDDDGADVSDGQDDFDSDFDEQDEGDYERTEEEHKVQYEDEEPNEVDYEPAEEEYGVQDDGVGAATAGISRLQMDQQGQQSDELYAGVSMKLFQQGVVQLQYLSKSNKLEQETRRWFLQHWKKKTKPFVRDIFLVLPNSPAAQQHEQSFDQFEAKTRVKMGTNNRKDYITHAYHGTKRNCVLGADPAKTNPCNNDCFVCKILKGKFRKSKLNPRLNFGAGIYTSTDSNKANQYSRNVNRGDKTKAVFLCSVITGRKRHLKNTNKSLTWAGPNRDSVVSWATGSNETVVYNSDQIKPHAVIMYSLQKTRTTVRPSPPLRHQDIYTIANNLFPKALQMDVNTHAIVGYHMHGNDNQLWILENDSGGWVFRNKAQPNMYLGLKQSGSHYNSAAIAGVSYNLRVVWELQKAQGNTYRIAIHSNNHWNLDLNVHKGNVDGTGITLWNHTTNAHQQRWYFDYVEHWNGENSGASSNNNNVNSNQGTYNPSGRGTQVQQPAHNGVYTLVNAKFRTVMDLAKSGGRVFGFKFLNGENQKWIFEQSGTGWKIRNKDDTTQYLGLEYSSFNDGTKLVPVRQSSRDIIIWEIKPAMHNSVRINPVGHWSKELDLSTRGGATNRTNIVLYHHINNAGNQRWELMYHGTV